MTLSGIRPNTGMPNAARMPAEEPIGEDPAHLTSAEFDSANKQLRMQQLSHFEFHPAGLEVHASGNVVHEVQPGDGWIAIARDYSKAFGMYVDWKQMRAANPQTGGSLFPGQLVTVPGLEAQLDAIAIATHPSLHMVGNEMRHEVQPGETLSKIARHYARTEHLRLNFADIQNANEELFNVPAGNPLPVGMNLRIPGVSFDSPDVSGSDIAELADQQLFTRTMRMHRPDGTLDSVELETYTGNVAEGVSRGASRIDALNAARWISGAEPVGGAAATAVVQTRDGHYWAVPLDLQVTNAPVGDGNYLSISMRSDNAAVIAIVEKYEDGTTGERMYDR